VIAGTVDTPGYALDVAAVVGHAWVATGDSLLAVDITSPAFPRISGRVEIPAGANGVAVSGGRVLVAGDGGLTVVDVTDPSDPGVLGSVDTPGPALDVAVSGDLAFVAGQDGLLVVDIADPGSPWVMGSTQGLHDTESVAVPVSSTQFVYVAGGHSGLQIVDVRDPAAPRLWGSADTPDAALGVAVANDLAYVVDYTAGLMILPVQCTGGTAVGHQAGDASRMVLSVWPNPSSTQTFVRFATTGEGRARVGVFDAVGRQVRDLSQESLHAGSHRLVWDGRDAGGRAVPAGRYFVAVREGQAEAAAPVVVIR
jgi:hypothetical protein